MGSDGPKESCLRWGLSPPWEGAILGKGAPVVKYRDFLPWAVQKRPNWLICRLGCGLGWAEGSTPGIYDGSTSSIIFARWRHTHWRHLANTILNLCFLRPTRVHNPNGKSIGSAVSTQLTAESPYTLQWATLSPKIAPSHGGIWTPSKSWFLGPIRGHNPNGISIGSAVFAGLTSVTDRPTDHATRSITIDRIYVRSTAMRSNNTSIKTACLNIYLAKQVQT